MPAFSVEAKVLIAIFVTTALMLFEPVSAAAQFVINSPKVEKREIEVEQHSSFQSGLPADEEDAIR